ncbi:DNA kinase/phosphatase Pnk1 [Mycoemilia scoparia]|uniref:DNA kinase/phosphatase Pnk1 n=1 Tax=Mycoemilia scoparia TaxID=417184 RepID=A0A9W8DTE4_9FUNG|nr:DNA kinase/phosphatase Pnk1 [Mycoemilia scoparia]
MATNGSAMTTPLTRKRKQESVGSPPASVATKSSKLSTAATATAADTDVHPFFAPRNKKSKSQSLPNCTNDNIQQETTATTTITTTEWREYGTPDPVLFVATYNNPQPSTKIAAFDLDYTIISPKGKHLRSKNGDDWMFWHPDVPSKLRQLHSDGFRILILSNQYGLAIKTKSEAKKKLEKRKEFKYKVGNVFKQLGVPITLLAAIQHDVFRKPSVGMWEWFKRVESNNGKRGQVVEIDMESSFFVGDAAGRPDNWVKGVRKDFSNSDMLLAWNIGLGFETPTTFFKHKLAPSQPKLGLNAGEFDPRTYYRTAKQGNAGDDEGQLPLSKIKDVLEEIDCQQKNSTNSRLVVVIMVGPPASGKSTISAKHLVRDRGFVHINQDTLGTKQKCIIELQNAINKASDQENSEHSGCCGGVVIDNTNPEEKTRAEYINIIKKSSLYKASKVRIYCVYMDVSFEIARHNCSFRLQKNQVRWFEEENLGRVLAGNEDGRDDIKVPFANRTIPRMVFNIFYSRLQVPDAKKEGLDKVYRVEFEPDFENEKEERQWRMYHPIA